MTASPDIFLSYNREDGPTAKAYAEAFARAGLEVWWDATLRSGEAYDKVTETALRGARAVVVLWSPRSVDSRWVRAEATIADRNGTLMPATIEPCDRPVMFELTQTADLCHWRGADQDPAWRAFLADVRRLLGRDEPKPVEAAWSPTPAMSGGGVPFVAVLPLTHRAGYEEMTLPAEDLTEDITRELARNSFFKVIAAGTMAAWRGRVIDHRALGRELEAGYLIEGRIQRVGETIRLTVQLIDTATGGMLRSARFACSLAEHAASPEEFAVTVACELGERITQIETIRAMTKQGRFSGWEHVLRAMAFTERLGPESQRSSLVEARSAVAAAPDLGLAHAVLAMNIGTGRALGLGEISDAQRRETHEHIRRAMQLDGDNPTVLYSISAAYAGFGDEEACLRLARRAVELAPNSPVAHCALGHACFAMGRTVEAITAYDKQLRLAPHDLNRATALMILGICFYVEGQPAEAEAAFDRSLALNPDYCVALMWKAVIAAHQGAEQAAKVTLLRLRETEPGMLIDQHLRLLVYYPRYRERLAGAVKIFRRLWDATGGDA